MNSVFSFVLIACTVTGVAYGQSKNQNASFPTYNQIKPADAEIIDYVPNQANGTLIEQKVLFKLFDYPDGSVTYILNGKETTNTKYAKEVLNRAGNRINSISIGDAATDGKRIIRVMYTTEK